MPFRSEAQRRKFRELVSSGEITQAEFDKWETETPKHALPERVGTKSPAQSKRAKVARGHGVRIKGGRR
jgi:hypothetical protein